MKIRYRKVRENSQEPTYGTLGAAGLDLYSAVVRPVTLEPGDIYTVPTGIAIEIPSGYEGHIRSRSSLGAIGIVVNTGTIDCDYRGELNVVLQHFGWEEFEICPGQRIAQLVISPVTRAVLECVDELSDTIRGARGFGSTGN